MDRSRHGLSNCDGVVAQARRASRRARQRRSRSPSLPPIRATQADVLAVGEIFRFERERLRETMGFTPCAACQELTTRAYLRVVGDKHVCIPCSGYDR